MSAHHGGVCIGCSRSDSGGGRNLIKAGRGESTSDGWEVLPLVGGTVHVEYIISYCWVLGAVGLIVEKKTFDERCYLWVVTGLSIFLDC